MSGLQDWIYHWGEGKGSRYLKFFMLFLGVMALAVVYDLRAYKCFSNPKAMELAQLARNLAEGKGYSTDCIRPFDLHLLQQRVKQEADAELRRLPADRQAWTPEQRARLERILQAGRLDQPLPDLANPPAYPALLAVFMQLAPFDYDIPGGPGFVRYQPEFLIAILNQTLFFVVVWMTFCLARRLFDSGVAWLTAVALMGAELFWQFSVSGLSTLLLAVVFLTLAWSLVWLEQGAEEFWSTGKLTSIAALAGLALGIGTLTRYSFACMALPAAMFMVAFLGNRRWLLCLVALAVFAAVTAPWLARNYDLCGAFFGSAGYTVHEGTSNFPNTQLPRSLAPDFTHVDSWVLPSKLVQNLRAILTNDLPRLGGSWVSAFFLAGLLIPFKSPILSRLRAFVLAGLTLFIAAQALARTPASADSPQVSPENLLILFSPLVFMFGVALFFTLLDQARAAAWEARPLLIGGFVLLACAPLVLKLIPPRSSALAYPPYSPPLIQAVARWMEPHEFMMSDIPWAVAWYGQRTCIWLPLNYQGDFEAIHRQRPVQGLYLTPQTLDNRFLTQWVQGENQGWGGFIAQSLLRREVPSGFPLVKAYADLFPEHLFLTDRERWKTSE